MGLTLAVDFGSTYTKLVAVDLDLEELVGVSQAKSTVESDITIGLGQAIERLRAGLKEFKIDRFVCCSSAAGGLRIVAVGLVKLLTTKAAEEAALGAGAKLVGTYSYGLTDYDILEIETQTRPDLILLTGGTDGGNKEVLLENAERIARSGIDIPIVIAGNRAAAPEAFEILNRAGKYAITEENVLPELDRLNVEPTRSKIREIFMNRITRAKGLDKAKSLVGDIIMPTPMAVLKAASLLAGGTAEEMGLGDLVVIDIGGATTDVHSVARGLPINPGIVVKGLPEPYEKRTVEGDLGIRYNAPTILERVGCDGVLRRIAALGDEGCSEAYLAERVASLFAEVNCIPCCRADALIDAALACSATDIAMQRHAGIVRESYFSCGRVPILYGKDLTGVKVVIGTGGVFAYGMEPAAVLQAATFGRHNPESMRPVDPALFIDERYMLYALGLLSDLAPRAALKIMKKHLKKVERVACADPMMQGGRNGVSGPKGMAGQA